MERTRVLTGNKETIKLTELVVGIKEHVSEIKIVDTYFEGRMLKLNKEDLQELIKYKKREVVRHLLKDFEEFVQIKVSVVDNYISARINLPLIQSKELTRLQSRESRLETECFSKNCTIASLKDQLYQIRKELLYEKLPWYKKLWMKIKG